MEEQLTIFSENLFIDPPVITNIKDTKVVMRGEPFDIKQANIKHRPGHPDFVDVLVIVPCDVWSADELPRSVRQDNHFDMYIDYVTAIWRYNRAHNSNFDWEAAEELCRKARESQEPQQIRIFLDSTEFKPQFVIEYV
ncbi:cell division protein SepF [Bacillus cereus group sp. BfR-BA-01522]|uniref:cell division protein SepF n=1 Tax=Bacillus cereus group sp. BfR-BA-01522 TaxID=2920370 RepID=UPI001F575C3B|nr:cell division protein SepF [Bacillus cereus group sp. BfR-BA-01522]